VGLFFMCIPLAFIAYGAAGGLIGGLLIVAGIAVVQLPIYLFLSRRLPRESTIDGEQD
jgi:hypothetical protein